MDSCDDTPKGWVAPFGHPRINACSRLTVAYRSVPRPSSPPGAKASTECPSLAREHGASKCAFHHAQKPSSVGMLPFIAESCSLSTQQSPLNTRPIAEHPKTFGQTVRWERPETHQNLIHPDKDLPFEFSPRDG